MRTWTDNPALARKIPRITRAFPPFHSPASFRSPDWWHARIFPLPGQKVKRMYLSLRTYSRSCCFERMLGISESLRWVDDTAVTAMDCFSLSSQISIW